jgi:hypothetical protein
MTEQTAGVRECGKTEAVSGVVYPPCVRDADHPEAFCRSANGDLFLTPITRAHP